MLELETNRVGVIFQEDYILTYDMKDWQDDAVYGMIVTILDNEDDPVISDHRLPLNWVSHASICELEKMRIARERFLRS